MDPLIGGILARYPAEAVPRVEPIPLGGAGGLSGASLWRLDVPGGRLVLRAWPEGTSRARVRQVHDWLAVARGLPFVARPIATGTGETFQEAGGRIWEVAPWLPGEPDRQAPPPQARLRSAFAALGSFHRAIGAQGRWGASPNLVARLEELEGWIVGGFAELASVVAGDPHDPLRATAARWLDLARTLAPAVRDELRRDVGCSVRLQPCLRDVRAEHLLFQGDEVSGLIDYGAAGIDCVATDLARLMQEWRIEAPADRSEALTAYEAVRPLTDAEIRLIASFRRSATLLGGGHWARWGLIEHRTFESPGVVVERLDHSVSALAGLAAARITP